MDVRNSSFGNGNDIPEAKLQETQENSQKDVEPLDHFKNALYRQTGNWSWSLCLGQLPKDELTLSVRSFHTHHKMSVSVQTSLYQLVIKLTMPAHCLGRG